MNVDPQSLKSVKELGRPEIAFCLARVPGTARLIYGASDGKVYDFDWTAEKPEPQPWEGHTSYVTGLALAGKVLVSGSYDLKLIWWNLETRAPVRTVPAHDKWIRGLRATPDGRWVVSIADDMRAKVWEAETGTLVHTLQDHAAVTPHHYPSMLYALAVSADSQLLATGDKVGHVAIWELSTGKKVGSVEAPGMYTWDPVQRRHSIGGIRSLAFSADGKLLAVGGIGRIGNIDHLDGPTRVEIFDWQAGQRLHEIQDDKFKGLVERLVFAPGGEWLLGAGGDHAGFVNFYNPGDGKILHQDKLSTHIHDALFNEDFTALYLAGHGKLFHYQLQPRTPAAAPANEPPAAPPA